MAVGWLKMAIFASFVHCLPDILHTWPHDSFQVIRLSMTLGFGHISRSLDCFTSNFSKTVCDTAKVSYYRLLIGNHTLAFDWRHFWWPWGTFEDHFSLGCHFHVHFSNAWHAFASHGLPAIAELLVFFRFSAGRSIPDPRQSPQHYRQTKYWPWQYRAVRFA